MIPNGDHVGYFEVLGANQQFVVEGMHKSGVPIKWINRPCDNPQNIPRITHAKLQAFLDDLRQEFETFGYRVEVVQGKNGTILRSSTNEGGTSEHSSKSAGGSGAGGSVRKSIDDPSRHAPSPQHVLRLLKVWRNTPENVPSHNEFVAAIAAIKTVLGPDREDYYSDILDWALEYRGNHKDYVRARWDSIS